MKLSLVCKFDLETAKGIAIDNGKIFVPQARCAASQRSDQMLCDECGIGWDMNDPYPPACGKTGRTP
jgi:hypothetical protein